MENLMAEDGNDPFASHPPKLHRVELTAKTHQGVPDISTQSGTPSQEVETLEGEWSESRLYSGHRADCLYRVVVGVVAMIKSRDRRDGRNTVTTRNVRWNINACFRPADRLNITYLLAATGVMMS